MPYSPIRVAQIDLIGLSGYISSVITNSQAVLVYGDQLSISGRKGFAGTIDFTGNTSPSGGINFNRSNYGLSQYGQFRVGSNNYISADPFVAQLYDLTPSAFISLDWNSRNLSGQWSTNTIPTLNGHLVNLGYLNTGNISANPYIVNLTSNQNIVGVKTFQSPLIFSSGATTANLSIFNPAYQDGDTIYETNSGNNVSWSRAQLQNNYTVYLNWTGQQLSGGNWKCDNFSPYLPSHIVNLSYLNNGNITFGGALTFSGANIFKNTNTFSGINLAGGNGITLQSGSSITDDGIFVFGGFSVFDPNTSQFCDASNAYSLNYNTRELSGQWKTNNSPSNAYDIVNFSYINSNFVHLTGIETVNGDKTLLGLTSLSGLNISGGSGIRLNGSLTINQSGAYQSGATLVYDPNKGQFNDFNGVSSINYSSRVLNSGWSGNANISFPPGSGIILTSGTNALIGSGILSAGAATISTNAVKTNSIIFLQRGSAVNTPALGFLVPTGIVAATSFGVRSLSAAGVLNTTDVGNFFWEIKNTTN